MNNLSCPQVNDRCVLFDGPVEVAEIIRLLIGTTSFSSVFLDFFHFSLSNYRQENHRQTNKLLLLPFMGSRPTKDMASNNQLNLPDSIPNPLSVYVPFDALTKQLLKSVISVVYDGDHRYGGEGSDRPLLCFLLAINDKLKEFEKDDTVDADSQAGRVRQWLVDRKGQPIRWKLLEEQFERIYRKLSDGSDRYKINDNRVLYYEMGVIPVSERKGG